MSCQVRYLRRVTRILEHHHVLSVQADGATFLVFRKQVLHEIEDGCVTVMTLFGEQGRDPTVRFSHQIIYDDEVPLFGIEQ